jgi:hypothetical protein
VAEHLAVHVVAPPSDFLLLDPLLIQHGGALQDVIDGRADGLAVHQKVKQARAEFLSGMLGCLAAGDTCREFTQRRPPVLLECLSRGSAFGVCWRCFTRPLISGSQDPLSGIARV